MVRSMERGTPGWGWGTSRQLLACRLSHALGLVVVLSLVLALGWMPASRTTADVPVAEPVETHTLSADADDVLKDGIRAIVTAKDLAAQGIVLSRATAALPICCPLWFSTFSLSW